MKITKILSAAAAAVVAVSAVAVSASADFRPVTGGTEYCLADGTGNYGVCLFSDGTNKDNVPAMSLDIDLSQVTHVAFTFDVIDDADNRDWWDGMGGGAIVVSAHSDKTNEDADLYTSTTGQLLATSGALSTRISALRPATILRVSSLRRLATTPTRSRLTLSTLLLTATSATSPSTESSCRYGASQCPISKL